MPAHGFCATPAATRGRPTGAEREFARIGRRLSRAARAYAGRSFDDLRLPIVCDRHHAQSRRR
jgi:hypothetical protein